MKKAIFSALCMLFVGGLYASPCPAGYAEVDTGELFRIVPDNEPCPAGFVELTPTPVLLPTPQPWLCDPARGTCGPGGVCQIPS